MDRGEFEHLRDLPGKVIRRDILLTPPTANAAYLESEKIIIENSENMDAFLIVRWNPQTDSKTVNVFVPGVGPICRLDVDGTVHRPCGRSHKHSLSRSTCPGENLKQNVQDRADLAGSNIEVVFSQFCLMANIRHEGALTVRTS